MVANVHGVVHVHGLVRGGVRWVGLVEVLLGLFVVWQTSVESGKGIAWM